MKLFDRIRVALIACWVPAFALVVVYLSKGDGLNAFGPLMVVVCLALALNIVNLFDRSRR